MTAHRVCGGGEGFPAQRCLRGFTARFLAPAQAAGFVFAWLQNFAGRNTAQSVM